jgi:hypothetical protein
MDKKLVASKQRYEVSYIAKKFNIPVALVRMAMRKSDGTYYRSRTKIYENIIIRLLQKIG